MNLKPIFFIIAFFEGASLMGVELMSARIIAAGFGTSVQVWAIVLSITLLGLSSGYYAGGKLSLRHCKRFNYLLLILFSSTLLVLSFPYTGKILINLFMGLGLSAGILFSGLFLIFPPLFLFGTVSPLLIDILASNETKIAGSVAGMVYGVSSMGGIIATFSFGLYFIPHLGVSMSSLVIGGSLLLSFILLIPLKNLITAKAS